MKKTSRAQTVPSFFRPILWSYRPGALDPVRHKKIIIAAAVNYGSLKHWRWIAQQYGRRGVGRMLASLPATAIRAHVRPLAAIIFSVKSFNNASRGAHKRRGKAVSKTRRV